MRSLRVFAALSPSNSREGLVARRASPASPSDGVAHGRDLKRIHKGRALAPVLLVRGDIASALPLIVADGHHRICAVCYFDESASIRCRIADIADNRA
jgi:hypothetical protein